MSGRLWGTADAMVVSNSIVDDVAVCWRAAPLRISMSNVEVRAAQLMTKINYTRTVTRSWIRVLLSEEAQQEVVAEQIAIYVTVPSINLPLDTARVVIGFLLADPEPVVVNTLADATILHVARDPYQVLPHVSYALLDSFCLQAALEERLCQEKALYDKVRSRCGKLLLASAHNYKALQILKQKIVN